MPGTVTSGVEVTHVSRHALWLLLGNEELAVPFAQFPWFKSTAIEQLSNVLWPKAGCDECAGDLRRHRII